MAKKKTINTFEGGLDQDTDKKLVKPNTIFSLSNGTITQDGNEGVITTFKDFKTLLGGININQLDQDLNVYIIQFNEVIPNGERILEYDNLGIKTDINASQTIENLSELVTELENSLSSFNPDIYISKDKAYLFLENITISEWGSTAYVYEFEVNSNISIGETLFDYTKNGIVTPYVTTTAISNVTELETELTTNFPFTLNYVNLSPILEVYTENIIFSNLNNKFTFTDDLNPNIPQRLTTNVLVYNNNFDNLGLKEISIKDNKRLIFLFRKDFNNVYYIQLIYYDDNTDTILGSGVIYKNVSTKFSNINNDNIIYLEEFKTKHTLYIVDNVYPDKVINIDVSLDLDDYSDFTTYIKTLREDLYSKSNQDFNEVTNVYFPRPELYDILYDNENGKVSPGDNLIFFYRLKLGDKISNISTFSKSLTIPTFDITFNTNNNKEIERLRMTSHNSNKNIIQFKIDSLNDLNYNEIEPYVIHYNSDNLFKIRKLDNVPIIDDKVIINYNEDYITSSLTEVELDSLLNINSTNNISKEQIIYKNRRIKANTRNTTLNKLLNFDSRAYRFDSSRNSRLYDVNDRQETLIDGSDLQGLNGYPSNEILDSINKFNDEYSDHTDWLNNQQYKFKTDGVTEGGEGPNVSYTFYNEQIGYEKLLNNSSPWDGDSEDFKLEFNTNNDINLPSGRRTYKSHRNPFIKRGFQSGEVYRFYLYFWQEDQVTLAKWIGDIKFPDKSNLSDYDTGSSWTKLYQNQIQFSVDTSILENEVSAVSIGYVPRSNSDKSVLFSSPDLGLHYSKDLPGLCFRDSNPEFLTSLTNDGGLNTDQTNDFNKLKKVKCFPFDLETTNIIDDYGGTDTFYLKELGVCGNALTTGGENSFRHINSSNTTGINNPNELIEVTKIVKLVDSYSDIQEDLNLDVPNTIIGNYTGDGNVGSEIFHPQLLSTNVLIGDRYPKSLVILESEFDITTDTQVLFSLRKKVDNQYGGAGYISRLSNEIEMASYNEVTGNIQTLNPDGDTFVCLPDEIIHLSEVQTSGGVKVTRKAYGTQFPIESSCNFHALESSEATTDRAQRFFDRFLVSSQDDSFYYNSNKYNSLPLSIKNLTINIQTSIQSEFKSSLIISNKKIIGEGSDNWSIFPVNNSKIIDPVWGEINKLIDEKDRLIIFQENAIAQQYVDQVQQNINDISEISLGTGDVVGQHIYLLKNIGVQSNESVIQLNDDVIYQDLIRNKIMTLNQGEIKGLSSELINDNSIGLNRKLTYDRQSNIVFIPNYIDYLDSSDSYLIAYDNNIKKITSDRSFVADFGESLTYTGITNILNIDLEGNLKVFNKSNTIDISNLTELLKLSFIVNPEPNVVKTFNNLFIDFETLEYDVNGIPSDVYDFKPSYIQIQTQYQDTGFVQTTNKNLRRRGRTWRFTIPRSQVDQNRIRDYYAIVTLNFPIIANRSIKITNIVTSYSSSNLS